MIDRFATLLNELGNLYDLPLHPDRTCACKLKIDEHLHIQLECDAHMENLLVASFICDIPPGKYRENILRDALKSNAPYPENGTLAYSEKSNKLVLFATLRLENLNGQKLSSFLGLFTQKANHWRVGVETGQTSHLTKSHG